MYHVVTVVSDETDNGFINFLKPSAQKNNLNLQVIEYVSKSLYGVRNKDFSLKKYLHNIDNDDVLLFVDGYDSVLMSDIHEIEQKFIDANIDVLFSGETYCWPDPRLCIQYPDKISKPYRYLNSGGFIGKVGILKELLEEDTSACDQSFFRWSNQYLWTLKYFDHTDKIGIDTKGNMFCSFANIALENKYFNDKQVYYQEMKKWFSLNFDIKEGRIFNKRTDTWPCIAHFNGFTKCIMDDDILNMISYRKSAPVR